jgi:hypothetical protein
VHGCDNPQCTFPSYIVCTEYDKNWQTHEKYPEHVRPVRPVTESPVAIEKRIEEIEKRYYSAVVIDNKLADLERSISVLGEVVSTHEQRVANLIEMLRSRIDGLERELAEIKKALQTTVA